MAEQGRRDEAGGVLARLSTRIAFWRRRGPVPRAPLVAPPPAPSVLPLRPPPPAPPPPAASEAPILWPPGRIAMVQRLFGEGFVAPGGAERARDVIRALGLDQTMSVLDLSGGLGGVGRLIARETGAWVTSVEADPALAALGMAMSTKAGLGRRAPVHPGDFAHPGVRPRTQNAVIAMERTFAVPEKRALFSGLRDLLKPEGYLTFTDYMLASPGADSPALARWRAAERIPPALGDPESHAALLRDLGFVVHVLADETAPFCARLVADFARFAEGLRVHRLAPEERRHVVGEAQEWLFRVAALDSGALRVYRVVARLPA